MAFHWKDGWFFERLEDGDVRVTPPNGIDADIPADEWVSIVAAVAKCDNPALTHEIAARLHHEGWAAVLYPDKPEAADIVRTPSEPVSREAEKLEGWATVRGNSEDHTTRVFTEEKTWLDQVPATLILRTPEPVTTPQSEQEPK